MKSLRKVVNMTVKVVLVLRDIKLYTFGQFDNEKGYKNNSFLMETNVYCLAKVLFVKIDEASTVATLE